jgi:predicted nucleic acid-binding protein
VAYLLDSDWVIDHLDQVPEALALLASFQGEAVYISMITYMEVYQGTLRGANQDMLKARLRDFISQVPILDFDIAVAERCARIRQAVLGVAPYVRVAGLMT